MIPLKRNQHNRNAEVCYHCLVFHYLGCSFVPDFVVDVPQSPDEGVHFDDTATGPEGNKEKHVDRYNLVNEAERSKPLWCVCVYVCACVHAHVCACMCVHACVCFVHDTINFHYKYNVFTVAYKL